jgi:hypothetical protein
VAIICWKIHYGVGNCADECLVVDMLFGHDLFEQYVQRFNRCSCTFLTKPTDPKGYFEPALCDMYVAGSYAGSILQAISYNYSSKASTTILNAPIKCCSL